MAADHVCEVCAPMRQRLEEEEKAHGSSFRAQAMGQAIWAMGRSMCAGKPPRLPKEYGPGGSQRSEFLEDRHISRCAPCQPIADIVTMAHMRARDARATYQAAVLDGSANDIDDVSGDHAAMATAAADVYEMLLVDCETRLCGKSDLERASEAVLGAIEGDEQPSSAPPPPGGTADPPSLPGSGTRATKKDGKVSGLVIGGIAVGAVLAVGLGSWALFGGGSSTTAQASTTTSSATTSSTTTTLSAAQQDGGSPDVTGQDVAGDEMPAVEDAYATSAPGLAALGIVADFGADPDPAVQCIANGLGLRATTYDELMAMANPDVSTWPGDLAERYAQVLEECVPLEPFYLGWFGSFDFEDPECVRIMTDHVLANWSWLRFLEMGILDPELRPALQTRFDGFVSDGYGEKGCFAASG